MRAALLALLTLAACGGKADEPSDPQLDPTGGDSSGDSAGGDSGGGFQTVEGTGGQGDQGGLDTALGRFDCGDKVCIAVYEYCYTVISGGGADSAYSCELSPEPCLPEPDCACLTTTGAVDPLLERCAADEDGNLFVELELP